MSRRQQHLLNEISLQLQEELLPVDLCSHHDVNSDGMCCDCGTQIHDPSTYYMEDEDDFEHRRYVDEDDAQYASKYAEQYDVMVDHSITFSID